MSDSPTTSVEVEAENVTVDVENQTPEVTEVADDDAGEATEAE